jgi:DNA-directed RNA polymerase subunit RPC12/RpoP
VRDANDQALAHIYSHENEANARRFNELTSDEARRIAEFFAGLSEVFDGKVFEGETRVAQQIDLAPRPYAGITPRDQVSSQSCVRCGTQMTLIQIEPDDPVHDRRIFECPTCRQKVRMRVRVVQYK